MAYPDAAAIRAELQALVNANSFCSLMTLQKSVKGVDITALKVSKVTSGRRTKVLFTGGVHANEFAPPKAILSLMTKLLDAYKNGRDITYGSFSVTATNVKEIIEHVDLYAAPMINPDGYALALAVTSPTNLELVGRKNARQTSSSCLPGDMSGININRNFDVVWDFQKHYAASPLSNVASSSDPCHWNYTGIAGVPMVSKPFSEPEAENVKTLLDEGIEFYVDCHMQGLTILHSWGIETDQTTDPTQSFTNPAFDGLRNGTSGVIVGFVDYEEFIPPAEFTEVSQIAKRMADAIKLGTDVPGRSPSNPFSPYTPQVSCLLYPTSGAADDYAYSRHFVNPALPFVRAFTIECGNAAHTGFRPTAAQYVSVEQEVHCALLALLKFVAVWIGQQNALPPPPPPPPVPAPPPTPTPPGPSSSNSSDPCPFILLLGSLHPAVELLRHLRDVAFRETAFGCRFIDAIARMYAAAAPPLARWLARRRNLQSVARVVLEPALAFLSAASGFAARLPSPSLRVAALIVAVAALPMALLAVLIAGVIRG